MTAHDLSTQLRHLGQRWRRVQALKGVGYAWLMGLIMVVSLCVMDAVLQPTAGWRQLALVVGIGLWGYAVWRRVIRPLRRPLTLAQVAWLLEAQYPELNESLISSVEFQTQRDMPVSHAMVEAIVCDLEAKVATWDETRTIPLTWKQFRLPLGAAMLCIVSSLLPYIHVSERLSRVVLPSNHDATIGAFQLAWDSDVVFAVPEGDSVTFKIRSSRPGLATVSLMLSGHQQRKLPMTEKAPGQYEATLSSVNNSFEVWAQSGDVRSQVRQLSMQRRPTVQGFDITYHYPSYMGLSDIDQQASTGDIKGYVGTTVTLQVHSSQPLQTMTMTIGKETLLSDLSANHKSGTFSFDISKDNDYTLFLQSPEGLSNRQQLSYRVQALADKKPTISWEGMSDTVFMDRYATLPLAWQSTDDFGVVEQTMGYRVNDGEWKYVTLEAGAFAWEWSLRQLLLNDGDLLQAKLSVKDALNQEASTEVLHVEITQGSDMRLAEQFVQAAGALLDEFSATRDQWRMLQRVAVDRLREGEYESMDADNNFRRRRSKRFERLLQTRISDVSRKLVESLLNAERMMTNAFYPGALNESHRVHRALSWVNTFALAEPLDAMAQDEWLDDNESRLDDIQALTTGLLQRAQHHRHVTILKRFDARLVDAQDRDAEQWRQRLLKAVVLIDPKKAQQLSDTVQGKAWTINALRQTVALWKRNGEVSLQQSKGAGKDPSQRLQHGIPSVAQSMTHLSEQRLVEQTKASLWQRLEDMSERWNATVDASEHKERAADVSLLSRALLKASHDKKAELLDAVSTVYPTMANLWEVRDRMNHWQWIAKNLRENLGWYANNGWPDENYRVGTQGTMGRMSDILNDLFHKRFDGGDFSRHATLQTEVNQVIAAFNSVNAMMRQVEQALGRGHAGQTSDYSRQLVVALDHVQVTLDTLYRKHQQQRHEARQWLLRLMGSQQVALDKAIQDAHTLIGSLKAVDAVSLEGVGGAQGKREILDESLQRLVSELHREAELLLEDPTGDVDMAQAKLTFAAMVRQLRSRDIVGVDQQLLEAQQWLAREESRGGQSHAQRRRKNVAEALSYSDTMHKALLELKGLMQHQDALQRGELTPPDLQHHQSALRGLAREFLGDTTQQQLAALAEARQRQQAVGELAREAHALASKAKHSSHDKTAASELGERVDDTSVSMAQELDESGRAMLARRFEHGIARATMMREALTKQVETISAMTDTKARIAAMVEWDSAHGDTVDNLTSQLKELDGMSTLLQSNPLRTPLSDIAQKDVGPNWGKLRHAVKHKRDPKHAGKATHQALRDLQTSLDGLAKHLPDARLKTAGEDEQKPPASPNFDAINKAMGRLDEAMAKAEQRHTAMESLAPELSAGDTHARASVAQMSASSQVRAEDRKAAKKLLRSWKHLKQNEKVDALNKLSNALKSVDPSSAKALREKAKRLEKVTRTANEHRKLQGETKRHLAEVDKATRELEKHLPALRHAAAGDDDISREQSDESAEAAQRSLNTLRQHTKGGDVEAAAHNVDALKAHMGNLMRMAQSPEDMPLHEEDPLDPFMVDEDPFSDGTRASEGLAHDQLARLGIEGQRAYMEAHAAAQRNNDPRVEAAMQAARQGRLDRAADMAAGHLPRVQQAFAKAHALKVAASRDRQVTPDGFRKKETLKPEEETPMNEGALDGAAVAEVLDNQQALNRARRGDYRGAAQSMQSLAESLKPGERKNLAQQAAMDFQRAQKQDQFSEDKATHKSLDPAIKSVYHNAYVQDQALKKLNKAIGRKQLKEMSDQLGVLKRDPNLQGVAKDMESVMQAFTQAKKAQDKRRDEATGHYENTRRQASDALKRAISEHAKRAPRSPQAPKALPAGATPEAKASHAKAVAEYAKQKAGVAKAQAAHKAAEKAMRDAQGALGRHDTNKARTQVDHAKKQAHSETAKALDKAQKAIQAMAQAKAKRDGIQPMRELSKEQQAALSKLAEGAKQTNRRQRDAAVQALRQADQAKRNGDRQRTEEALTAAAKAAPLIRATLDKAKKAMASELATEEARQHEFAAERQALMALSSDAGDVAQSELAKSQQALAKGDLERSEDHLRRAASVMPQSYAQRANDLAQQLHTRDQDRYGDMAEPLRQALNQLDKPLTDDDAMLEALRQNQLPQAAALARQRNLESFATSVDAIANRPVEHNYRAQQAMQALQQAQREASGEAKTQYQQALQQAQRGDYQAAAAQVSAAAQAQTANQALPGVDGAATPSSLHDDLVAAKDYTDHVVAPLQRAEQAAKQHNWAQAQWHAAQARMPLSTRQSVLDALQTAQTQSTQAQQALRRASATEQSAAGKNAGHNVSRLQRAADMVPHGAFDKAQETLAEIKGDLSGAMTSDSLGEAVAEADGAARSATQMLEHALSSAASRNIAAERARSQLQQSAQALATQGMPQGKAILQAQQHAQKGDFDKAAKAVARASQGAVSAQEGARMLAQASRDNATAPRLMSRSMKTEEAPSPGQQHAQKAMANALGLMQRAAQDLSQQSGGSQKAAQRAGQALAQAQRQLNTTAQALAQRALAQAVDGAKQQGNLASGTQGNPSGQGQAQAGKMEQSGQSSPGQSNASAPGNSHASASASASGQPGQEAAGAAGAASPASAGDASSPTGAQSGSTQGGSSAASAQSSQQGQGQGQGQGIGSSPGTGSQGGPGGQSSLAGLAKVSGKTLGSSWTGAGGNVKGSDVRGKSTVYQGYFRKANQHYLQQLAKESQ